MKYDGVLQPWYPAQEHPTGFTSIQYDVWRTGAMTFYSKLSWQIWPTADSLRERHVAIYQNSPVYRFNSSVFRFLCFVCIVQERQSVQWPHNSSTTTAVVQ